MTNKERARLALAVVGGGALVTTGVVIDRATQPRLVDVTGSMPPGSTVPGTLPSASAEASAGGVVVSFPPSEAPELPAAPTSRPATQMEKINPKEALKLGWTDGKYQTYPRAVFAETIPGVIQEGTEGYILQDIDLGTLGPDVDTIVGIDFPGDIQTGALIVSQPTEGPISETRVVFIKRADLETVQIRKALGGDRFDIYKASEHGGDHALEVTAKLHAQNTARKHQKVVYLGDLGLFETQWGDKEQPLLQRIIKAQRPSKAGIPEPDFVNERIFLGQ